MEKARKSGKREGKENRFSSRSNVLERRTGTYTGERVLSVPSSNCSGCSVRRVLPSSVVLPPLLRERSGTLVVVVGLLLLLLLLVKVKVLRTVLVVLVAGVDGVVEAVVLHFSWFLFR
jgi:hypothetical protein